MANTTNQGWAKPTVGGSEDTWGTTINAAIDAIDTLVGPVTAAEIAVLDGLTASTAELNKLDGLTASTTELNKLDGVTASTAELNYVDGVTSSIQSQIDTLTSSKQNADATLTGLAGLATGSNKIPYSTGTNTFSQLTFRDEDNMSSNSSTSVPSQQSVKAYVDASSPITTTSGSAPYYGARAWGKVSGNSKLAGGNFSSWSSSTNRVTFSTSMPHANYAVTVNSPSYGNTFARNMTSSGFEVVSISSGGNVFDVTSFEFVVIC